MPTLQDQLEALAPREPVTTPTAGLWERGRRYGRRRRAGAVLVGGAGLVVVALLTGWLRASPLLAEPVPVAGSVEGLRLPDVLAAPSPWLPTAEEPTGPLVAVLPAARATFLAADRSAVVGVDGTTGAYAFLDLPDLPSGELVSADGPTRPALSADGRFVAYWYAGDAEEEPVDGDEVLAGVAVHDTVTGEVVRRPVPSPHGLSDAELLWSGDRLWMSWFAWDSSVGDSARSPGLVGWEPATGEEVALPAQVGLSSASPAGDGSLLVLDGALEQVGPGGSGGGAARWPLDAVTTGPAYLSPDGRRVAVLADPDGRSNASDGRTRSALLVGALGEPGTPVRLREAGDRSWSGLLGWSDDGHVVAAAPRRGGDDPGPATVLATLDVTSGFPADLTVQDDSVVYDAVLAGDALSAPVYAAPAPLRPWSPRWVAAGVALTGVAAAVGLLLWRRRVRP